MSLHLTHLKVEQCRRFRQPFELNDLQPGLNLICGPNEAGKSTLVRAIRAAFFERYRSTAVDDLRPWGDSGATPHVEIGFQHDGVEGWLSKSFLGSKRRCDLRIGTRSWQGAEAEDHLAQWLGFGFAAKGASKPEHWGIPGLLWVSQGTGHELQAAADHAQMHLHQALASHGHTPSGEGALTALTATEGDAVLAQVEAQRDALLTATGRPKGALAEALAQRDAVRERVAALQQQVQRYRQEVDALSRTRADHQRDETERPWDALEAQLAQAREALQQAEQARQLLDEAQARESELLRQQQWAQQALQHWARQAQVLAQRQTQAQEAADQAQHAAQALARAQAQRAHTQQAQGDAQGALAQARLHEQRQQWQQSAQVQARELQATRQALQQAEQAEQALMAAQQPPLDTPGAAVPSLTEADLRRLRALQATATQARLRVEGLATRLRHGLPEGQVVRCEPRTEGDARVLQGEGEQWLLGATRLVLPGGGWLEIEPGGVDLAERAQAAQQAEAAWHACLREWAVPDLEAAEARWQAQAQRRQQGELAEQALKLVAPQGVAALRAQEARQAQELQALQDSLSRAQAERPADEHANTLMSVAEASAACQLADEAAARAQAAEAKAQSEHAAATARAESSQREWQLAQQQATQAEQQQERLDTQARLQAVEAQLLQQRQRVQACEQQLAQARPEIWAQDISRLTRSLAQMHQTHQQRHTQLALMAQSLAQQGAQGLEEQLAQAQAQASHLERRCTELQRRADALDLLRERLLAHRQAALARLQAPLQAHLQRYLGLLFPGASLSLSDQLLPVQIQRLRAGGPAEVGSLDDLSFGAREQLGLISRLAYADLLREAGRPTLIILDDVLVHTDAERLTPMKRVLFDAATRHQVLLFSCHPERWRDLGMAPRWLPTP